MIINIGDDNYILKESIISIIDKNAVKDNKIFKEFLSRLEENKALKNQVNNEEKSYIIVEKNGRTEVYLSKISSKTLEKRNNLNRWR